MFAKLLARLALAVTPALGACLPSGNPDPMVSQVAGAQMLNVPALLASDMRRRSEALPHGVPLSYDWAASPRVGYIRKARDFKAFTGWGQLYRCARSVRTPRQPIQLRDMQSWALERATGSWRLLQSSERVRGASYPEDFKGRTKKADVLRQTSRATTVRLVPSYNFHFWPESGRASLNVSQVRAVAVVFRARFAPNGLRRRPPCAVLGAGGDFWKSTTDSPGKFISPVDAGIGRLKRVRKGWRLFSMTDANARTLAAHPLPVNVRRGVGG